MLRRVDDQSSKSSKGLNTQPNILGIDPEQSPNMMNVKVNFDGSLEKRLGTDTRNSVILAQSSPSGFTPISTATLANNLIAFWPLNESSGKRSDNVGGNDLSSGNNTGQSGGIRNQAALFISASNNYLYHANTSTLATGDIDFFMSSWFYLNSTGDYSILSKSDLETTGGGNDSNTVLLLHGDGTHGSKNFTDSSPSAHVATSSNTISIDTGSFVFGSGSIIYGNTQEYLSFPNNSDWNFGTGDFTIDFRFRVPDSDHQIIMGDGGENDWINWYFQPNRLVVKIEGTQVFNVTPTLSNGSWYHLALARQGTTLRIFVDGAQQGSDVSNSASITSGTNIVLGRSPNNPFVATRSSTQIDEFRISNSARYVANFTPPTSAYSVASSANDYEYELLVETDNIVTFRVSSSGFAWDGSVRCNSFGAVSTSTWYNAVGWHDTGNTIGVSVNLLWNTGSYASGVRSGSAPFVIGSVSDGATRSMDGRIDEAGFWKTLPSVNDRLFLYNSGNGITYQVGFDNFPWASFDFGASSLRWLVCSAGTGIYASSDLGVNWTSIATDRTANYQSLNRSKNILIATSESYDNPLYWTGSAGSFTALLNNSAPLCKYSINFQGFTVLLNSNTRKRGFFYEDENTHLTGDWGDDFDVPSSEDDEITGAAILRKRLYVSTRYRLFRVSFVGGNPDFEFLEVKNWGFIPRTIKKIVMPEVGEVIVGASWDQKIRLFDGADDRIISDPIEKYNSLCDFSLDQLSYSGSGPVITFAETDDINNTWRMCMALGSQSTQTTHFINFDARTNSFYPESNRQYNTMVMAESGNKRYLVAFDRSGFCHMIDSGNLDSNTTPVDDVFQSHVIVDKTPSSVKKGYQTDLYFRNTTSGNIYYLDRKDFSNTFSNREVFSISGSDNKYIVKKEIDVPETYNAYEYMVTSSSGTGAPWKLIRRDHFSKNLGVGR